MIVVVVKGEEEKTNGNLKSFGYILPQWNLTLASKNCDRGNI